MKREGLFVGLTLVGMMLALVTALVLAGPPAHAQGGRVIIGVPVYDTGGADRPRSTHTAELLASTLQQQGYEVFQIVWEDGYYSGTDNLKATIWVKGANDPCPPKPYPQAQAYFVNGVCGWR